MTFWERVQRSGVSGDARARAVSVARNREPILEVLCATLPSTGTVLELASGTGEHAAWFAPRLPHLRWQPTDILREALASIEAWRESVGASNLLPPARLDVREPVWPIERADAVVCINLVQVAPWEDCLRMLDGVARVLRPGGPLVFYGPLRIGGEHVSESNAAFDAGLRAHDPRWGVRDREMLLAAAEERGLDHVETRALPRNNFALVLQRALVSRTAGKKARSAATPSRCHVRNRPDRVGEGE